jgi:hypothetical protein
MISVSAVARDQLLDFSQILYVLRIIGLRKEHRELSATDGAICGSRSGEELVRLRTEKLGQFLYRDRFVKSDR